jgi:hypothetical protein
MERIGTFLRSYDEHEPEHASYKGNRHFLCNAT